MNLPGILLLVVMLSRDFVLIVSDRQSTVFTWSIPDSEILTFSSLAGTLIYRSYNFCVGSQHLNQQAQTFSDFHFALTTKVT